jgi:hypothetical protein
MMPQERRVRAYVNIRVKADVTANHLVVIRDISLSGCLLATGASLYPAQAVLLGVPVPGGGGLGLRGTVVRRGEGADGTYGLSFAEMSAEERRGLALFVAEGVEPPPAA